MTPIGFGSCGQIVPRKIGLDRVKDRVTTIEIKLKIEFTLTCSLKLN